MWPSRNLQSDLASLRAGRWTPYGTTGQGHPKIGVAGRNDAQGKLVLVGLHFFPRPKPGDIVWCKFAQHSSLKPGPKSRPALVLKVGDQAAATWVQVAYGTSQKVDRLFPGEFVITPSDGDAYVISGLTYATKFDLAS